MTRIIAIATTALTLAAAAPALASPQLARSLDVEPGTATLAQLVELKGAVDSDNRHAERVIRAEIAETAPQANLSSRSMPSAAHAQLARSLDVEPGSATLSQLVQLKGAVESDEQHAEQVIRAEIAGSDPRAVVSSRSAPAAGAAQLARSLDVEPGTATLAELVELKGAVESDDHHAEQVIRARIAQ
jgi:hypothetical protein